MLIWYPLSTQMTPMSLQRRPGPPELFLKLDAQSGAVLGAKAAMIRADTGFDRAQPFGIGMSRHHAGRVQIGPDVGQILAFYTQ